MKDKLQHLKYVIERDQAIKFAREYPSLEPPKVKIIHGNKYIKVDVGDSGKYLVDHEGKIFGIKAYGVIHRRLRFGTLDSVDQFWWGDYHPVMKPYRA